MKKSVVLVALCLALITLASCSSTGVEDLKKISPMNNEANVAVNNISVTDKEAAIYAQVSNRVLLNLSTLAEVPETDRQAVESYMESVDAQLCGQLPKEDYVINQQYTDYLLAEFARTPYYFQRSAMSIRGMDTSSRSIICDVTYSTLDFTKEVIPESPISLGEPNYEQKMSVRFQRWMDILGEKYKNGSAEDNLWQEQYTEFESVYGSAESILESQKGLKPTESIFEEGNQETYSGLIDSDIEQGGATFVIRYVIVPEYSMGVNLGYTCKHLYVLSYALDNSPIEGKDVYSAEGSETISDTVYYELYAYYQSMDEANYTGMYNLVENFNCLDKYYYEYFDTTYRKSENFTLTLLGVQGSDIECSVTLSNKVRAKGTDMTLPIYTDKIYYKLSIIDGVLVIANEVLVSRELEGEPVISTSTVETTGLTSTITLENSDKVELEQAIADFGVVQLLKDTSSDSFSDIVDTSLTQNQLDMIKDNMLSISGTKRVTWLVSYLQGTSNYASIACKELFQSADGTVTEADVTYDFINKGNIWYIYNYSVLNVTRLDTKDLSTKNSLCVVSLDGIDSLTSQVSSTGSIVDTEAINVSVDYTYDAYEPIIKLAEVAINITDVESLTEADVIDYLNTTATAQELYDEYMTAFQKKYVKETADGVMLMALLNADIPATLDKRTEIFQELKVLTGHYKDSLSGYITAEEFDPIKTDALVLLKQSLKELAVLTAAGGV